VSPALLARLPELVQVVLITGSASVLVALVGAVVLRILRRRSLLLLIPVVAATSVLSVLAGAVGTSRAMFLSPHDFSVLLVVVVVAGTVSLTTAGLLGSAVVRRSRGLGNAARSLAATPYAGSGHVLPAELAALDAALSQTSVELARSREREERLGRSRQELVASFSHDLRTPLAGIRAMSEALEDGVVADPATVQRYHRGIRTEADRMTQMVDDLFELSRINAHAIPLQLQDVLLGDLVSDAVAAAAPVAAEKRVRLTGDAAGAQVPVRASVPEMSRVLRNLLANAIRHTPADGSVHVRAHTSDGQGYVEVADACGGIPEQDLPRVFDVAFRGTAARTPGDDGGAGLGLAISRGLVHAHRGEISITNAGPGCRVLVRIPAQSTAG